MAIDIDELLGQLNAYANSKHHSFVTLQQMARESAAAIEFLQAQIDKLANFIIEEVPGEPSQSEGAVDTAIIWMRTKLAPPTADAWRVLTFTGWQYHDYFSKAKVAAEATGNPIQALAVIKPIQETK